MTSPPPFAHSQLTSFYLFPTLPSELQQQIWHVLASSEAQQRGSHNHRIAWDATSPQRSSVKDPSNIKFRIVNQPHYLPKCLQVCANSREISQRLYTRWERCNGGYIYVNESTDIIHFAGRRPKFFWFLDAAIAQSRDAIIAPDEVALSQFKEQLQGVQRLGFDYFIWRELYDATHPEEPQSHLSFQRIFPNVKVLVVTLPSNLPGIGDERVSDRRYKLLELDDLMTKAGSALKRHGQFLGITFDVVMKSYPASCIPIVKTALHVKEREYMNIPEENRFTCVCPPLEAEMARTPAGNVVQANTD